MQDRVKVTLSSPVVPVIVRNCRHPVFIVYSEPVGDTVNVVEVGDYLCGDGNLFVTQTIFLQATRVGLVHSRWCQRQFDRKVT